jgi:hypothetical protein
MIDYQVRKAGLVLLFFGLVFKMQASVPDSLDHKEPGLNQFGIYLALSEGQTFSSRNIELSSSTNSGIGLNYIRHFKLKKGGSISLGVLGAYQIHEFSNEINRALYSSRFGGFESLYFKYAYAELDLGYNKVVIPRKLGNSQLSFGVGLGIGLHSFSNDFVTDNVLLTDKNLILNSVSANRFIPLSFINLELFKFLSMDQGISFKLDYRYSWLRIFEGKAQLVDRSTLQPTEIMDFYFRPSTLSLCAYYFFESKNQEDHNYMKGKNLSPEQPKDKRVRYGIRTGINANKLNPPKFDGNYDIQFITQFGYHLSFFKKKRLKKSGVLETAIGFDVLQMNPSAEVLENIYNSPRRYLDWSEAFAFPFISWTLLKKVSPTIPNLEAGPFIKIGYTGNSVYGATYLIKQDNIESRQLNLYVRPISPFIFHLGPSVQYDFEFGRKSRALSVGICYQIGLLGNGYSVDYDYVFNDVTVSSGSMRSRVNYLQFLLSYYL